MGLGEYTTLQLSIGYVQNFNGRLLFSRYLNSKAKKDNRVPVWDLLLQRLVEKLKSDLQLWNRHFGEAPFDRFI